jgi:hypothetical protein
VTVALRSTQMSTTDRVDRLDLSLFDEIPSGGTSSADRRSLLALQAALATRGDFTYLEVGSYLGASMQSFIVDSRCQRIVSIDRRDAVAQDERSELPGYPDNSTAHMLEHLAHVPGADLHKLRTIEAGTDEVDPTELRADLCFIDGEHTDQAALRDARFCRRVVRDRGVIVFHDRTIVDRGIRAFLSELPHFRAYPLSHELLVVELGVPSLLSDPRVREQVPRAFWSVVARLRAVRAALSIAAMVRQLEALCGRILLMLGAPRRSRRAPHRSHRPCAEPLFLIYTFVNDDELYRGMVATFTDAGFNPAGLVRLTDQDDNPYAAITRIGRVSAARYPILCHQDVRPDRGAGAVELAAGLTQLDTVDPDWVVAGIAGVMRNGRGLRRVVDLSGGSTARTRELLPLPVVSLDECFLVFNGRNAPRCSAGISGFHLYASDVCLQALSSAGAAYVIDFPITHLGRGTVDGGYEAVKNRFVEIWNEHFLFCYLPTQIRGIFLSRSRILRRVFGSGLAMTCVGRAARSREMRSQHRRVPPHSWLRFAPPAVPGAKSPGRTKRRPERGP